MLARITDASYSIDGRLLFDNVEMAINEGDHVALIGRNGCGKSTLLKILAGTIQIDSGTSESKKNARILLVKQELPSDNKTPIEYLKDADLEITHLNSLLEQENSNITSIYDEINQIEDERYGKEAILTLSALGITKEKQNQPMRELSGGLRMRVALASGLLQYPDVLLLDEPTNHLDLPSIIWLTEFLKTYPRPFVIVSHDRALLSTVVNKTYHLQQGSLTCYHGDFDTFIEQYQLMKEQSIRTNNNTDKKIEEMQKFIDKFKAKPKWSAIAKTREQWIVNLNAERPDIIREEPLIPVSFPECEVLKNPIFSIKTGTASYNTTIVLSKLNFSIQADSRIGILGCNGQGKSTLVRMIMNQFVKVTGDIYSTPKLRIGYFSQEQSDVLNKDLTVIEQFKLASNDSPSEMLDQLLHFGFNRDKCTFKIDVLSGGEKTRLLLAMIAANKPHLIILDEPTNHLDFETKQTLIEAITTFNGAVVLVSHDWDLLDKTMENYWVVSKGTVTPYTKGLNHYRTCVLNHLTSLSAQPASSIVKKAQNLTLLPPPNKENDENTKSNHHPKNNLYKRKPGKK